MISRDRAVKGFVIAMALLCPILIVVGAYQDMTAPKTPPLNEYNTPTKIGRHWIKIIDDCEYLLGGNGQLSHKGNCKNPEHRENK